MQYTQLSNYKIEVSKICLGTMTFGTPVGKADAIKLVHYAFDKGINFIDTANMYEGYARFSGSLGGVAEEIVGEAIKGNRSKYIIATKLGMKVGEAPEDEFTSPLAIEKQLDKSLKRLNTDYIDIYYLHKYDPNTTPDEICSALYKQLRLGKIRSYAVSNYSKEQLDALIKASKRLNMPLPAMCQPSLSLINTAALEDVFPICNENNIAIVPYQVLQSGILTGKYKRGQAAPKGSRAEEMPSWVKPLDDVMYDTLERYEQKANESGITMTQYAIRWALKQKGVASALVGIKNTNQIDEAVGSI